MKFKELIWALGGLIIVLIIALGASAAFVGPITSYESSNQDFSQNILGANNDNNLFNSSSVAGNKNGSILEMLEYINNRMTAQGQWYSGECANSTTGTKTNCYIDDTAKYVHNTACSASSNNGYCYIATSTLSLLDLDLIASNIKKDINIFGVTGSAPNQIECCSKNVWSGSGCVTDYCTLGTGCSAFGSTDWDYSVYTGGAGSPPYSEFVACYVTYDGERHGNACMCRLKQ
jgi:hypothetical protein